MVRKFTWYGKLGLVSHSCTNLGFPRSTLLSCILPNGGLVGTLDVVVQRKYPLVYMEKIEGKTNLLNKAAGESRLREIEMNKEKMVEKVSSLFNVIMTNVLNNKLPVYKLG